MTKIEQICTDIYDKARGYNISGYKENKLAYSSCLNGILECLITTGVIDGYVIDKNYNKRITEIRLRLNKPDKIVNVIIDVENHVAISSLWKNDLELSYYRRNVRGSGIRRIGRRISI